MKKGWEVKILSEICDFQNGFAFKSNLFKESGLPILQISNIQDEIIETRKVVYFDPKDYENNLDKYKVVKGDLLIAMSGATTGKIGFNQTNQIFYLNQRVGKFEPKISLLKKYLFYFLSTRVEENLRISAGSAQPNLSTEQIKNFEVPLPSNVEQQRIVNILDDCFARIATAKANTEKNLQNARALFDSYLDSVFTKRGEGWEEKTLSEVCTIKPPKSEAREKVSATDNVSFLPMEDLGINQKFVTPTRMKTLTQVVGSYTYFSEGDVLLAKITPCFENGKLGIAANLENKIGFGSSEYIVFRADKSVIIKEWIYYLLSQQLFRDKGAQCMTGAVGHKRVSKEFIESYPIIIPPLEIQENIVRNFDMLLEETQRLESIYQRKLNALDALKKSLLHQAFSGEL